MTWQPIESAPKDGTAVWILVNGRPYMGYYEPSSALRRAGQWFVKASFQRRDRSEKLPDEIYGTYDSDVHPTRWQPLPDPPVQS